MIRIITATLLALSFITLCLSDTWVNGYTKKDGTYVSGHYRSDANNSTDDNYSTYGNTNIYTEEKGTKKSADNDLFSTETNGKTWVNGYHKKDGTWVNGYYRNK